MARKYDLISELYERTAKDVIANSENWQAFLSSACYNYRLRFDEQLLVYAQRPDAKAILEIERWNRQFGRWVNKGAHGIAVFEDANRNRQILKHYFDVSDTHPSRYSRALPLWNMKEEYTGSVIESLENTFGQLEDKTSLVSAIRSAAKNASEDNLNDYLGDFQNIVKGTEFEQLSHEESNRYFIRYATNSIAYMLMRRLDVDTRKAFEPNVFDGVSKFSSKDTLNAFGIAVSDIAKMGLSEIARTILALDRGNRIIADVAGTKYNEAINTREGSKENEEDRIHNAGRLQFTQPDTSGATGGESGTIRKTTQDISQGESQDHILQPAYELQVDGAPGRGGSESSGDGRNFDEADVRAGGTDREPKSDGYDDVGEENEQFKEQSSGVGDRRDSIQVEHFDRETEDNSLPFFGGDEAIHQILLTTPHLKASKADILTFFSLHEDTHERTEYIKSIFNNDYTELFIGEDNDRRVGYKTFDNVLHLWEGSYLSRTAEAYYNWSVIERHFEAMRLLGELKDISKPLPSIEGQISALEDMGKEIQPAFSFSQEIIDAVLTRGTSYSEGKMRVYEQFQKSLSHKENVDFLKKEYGWGGSYPVITGTGIDEEHSAKGIKLSKRTRDDRIRITLSWPVVEKRISELISIGRYLNKKEKEAYPKWYEKQQILREELEEKRANRQILNTAPPEKEEDDSQYEFHLGDRVYIGACEYEVLNLDPNRVLLYDAQFPLLNKEMDREEFESKVRENPFNNHLKVKAKENVDEPLKEDSETQKEESESQKDDFELQALIGQDEKKIEVEEELKPSWEKKHKRVQSFDIHPEIPMALRNTFELQNNEVEIVGKKERFSRNVEAINLLKKCQEENRFATPDEQITLSKYVGWGGIPEAFDENNSSWSKEYFELKGLLDQEEYMRARESTLTAFYTPPDVISAIYKTMEQMGFQEGNVLEPSCGIGNFIGMVPDRMKNCRFYGVEIDSISAGIAQQLYQKSSIATQGYEKTNLPDSFFDAVVGNVPFGDFKVADKRYDKLNFLIHDFFFAKSLDKLRPGGIMALVTSKGTMDKDNPSVRKYIAQRADLLGAIRLPNNTFSGNAGTNAVSDILILQKRDRIVDIEPEWVHLDTDENGIKMNSYYVSHPEMILGEMKMVSGRFGPEATCMPYENESLSVQLDEAISNIHGEVGYYEVEDELTEEDNSILADPTVRNFSYTVLNDVIYFRENSRMTPVSVSATAANRIKGLIKIRDCVRNLIELQTEDYPDEEIQNEQYRLNNLYDKFTGKYGLINSRANNSAFSQDSSYSLLSALEVLGDDGVLERKADMFTRRTIKPHKAVNHCDTISEALAVSISEKAKVDMAYMCELTGKTEEEIFTDLQGVIFLNPLYKNESSQFEKYLMADEYLSGNVREKLAVAKNLAEIKPDEYTENVKALERVQPVALSASEIAVRLGATWIPHEIVKQFIFELLDTPRYAQWNIKVHFSPYTSEWNIEGKSYDSSNIKAYSTYGTSRMNAYKIIEETLNLKDVRIFDYVEDEEGRKKPVLNKKETAIAQSKQEMIKQGFINWIWTDPLRRERLTKLYNEKYNSTRPREYDGGHISFNGMNPEIELRDHQKNAVAHILYGGNTLLAHAVGAGKTYEMAAAAMESKKLGLCNKSLFVVPNHLTEQWAAEFLQLYPAANILVATKKDFETKNRKRFCGRIATGDYDAVIIGHSQFEKIPMSIERQRAILEQQLEEITEGIAELKRNRGERFSVKQLEKSKKSLQAKLEKLNDQSRKDDVVTFEELGCDRLFIDESHYYKNLFLYTKMRNVGGIAQTEAQKSSDLFMKCRYLDELTGGRGIVFATGTPISNSMVELYTIQRYLQYNTLKQNGLQHFDSWASTFGETITAVELTPEGTGYRAKTRFARFYNLPELMAMFKEVADIQTADMLKLPVPKANFHNISVKPTEMQKKMVAALAERAEKIREGTVDSHIDNMLKITNDGRKLALDQRMMNDMLPDEEGTKVNACVNNIYKKWDETTLQRSTQLVFCDLSTPHNDGTFTVYEDIRSKLISLGIPKEEIAFIHDADTEAKKQELFKKVRKGDVRILLGSTAKMGAGTNVQNKIIATHDIDCPWRPSDLEQRLGRTIRQGNENPEVEVYRYVTEETFDSYLYQLVEGKQKFASQIMTSKFPVRSAEDIDETALSYAEIKMLATGNEHIKEKMDLDIQVQKLKLLKASFLSEKYSLEDKIIKYYPKEIARLSEKIENLKADINIIKSHPKQEGDSFVGLEIKGVRHAQKQEAGKAIIEACKAMNSPDPIPLGKYRGFNLELSFNTFERSYEIKVRGDTAHIVTLGDDVLGNITRIDNKIERIPEILEASISELTNVEKQFDTAKQEVEKPFSKEEELKKKSERLDELNILLNLDKRESELIDGEPDESDVDSNRTLKNQER